MGCESAGRKQEYMTSVGGWRAGGKFYMTAVRPALLYGVECSAITKNQEQEIQVAEMRMLKYMSRDFQKGRD